MGVIKEEYKPIIEILEDIFGDYSFHNDHKGQISFDCPVCSYDLKGLDKGDGKGNLEVNYKDEVYKCWVCYEVNNTSGSLIKLIKKYGNAKQLKKYILLRPENEENEKIFKEIYVRLPREFIPFSSVSMGMKLAPAYKQAINYIRKRKITDEMLVKYNIGFCYDGFYSNRIIVPSYDEEDRVNYFIGRSYLDNIKPKFRNPEAHKELIVWNEHLIDWNQPVYIVEGVFDSIFLPNSIPMLGKKMSDKLFMLLYEKAKKIILVLDPDAKVNQELLYHRLNCGKLFGKVWVIEIDGDKDVADLEGNLENYKPKQLD